MKAVSAVDVKRAAARQPLHHRTVPAAVRKASATALLKGTAAHARVRPAAAVPPPKVHAADTERKHRVQAHARAAAPGPVAAPLTVAADAGVMPSEQSMSGAVRASMSVSMSANPLSNEPLDELFRRAAAGDSAAMEHAARALYPVLHRFCGSRLLNAPAEVEDVVQGVLLELCERVWEYDPRGSALGWALTLARWQCLSVATRERRTRDRTSSPGPDSVHEGAAEQSREETELQSAFERARARLSESDRLLLQEMLENDMDTAGADAAARKRRSRLFARLKAAWRNVHESD